MDKEIIKAGILNPEIIPNILSSNLLVDVKIKSKLDSINKTYLKTQKIPSTSILNNIFGIDLDVINEADNEAVYQMINETNLITYANKILEELFNDKNLTIDDIHDMEKKYLNNNFEDNTESRFCVSSFEDLLKLKNEMELEEQEFIETGFKSINELTKGDNKKLSGGWRPGSLYSIMGLSGTGKSIFLTNFARDSWSLNNNVLYITTEMGYTDTYNRIFKSYYNVDDFNDVILHKDKLFPACKVEVVKVHPNDTTVTDLQRIIERLDWKPDIIFIDYADELKCHEKSNNEYEGQGIVYAGLKKLAEVNHVPVITATQTNRDAEDKEKGGTKKHVSMSTISDSSKKIRLVDMLFAITQSVEEKKEHILNLQVLKNRFGENHKKIRFNINYGRMHLSESSKVVTKVVKPKPMKEQVEPTIPESLDIERNRRGRI